MAISTMQSGNLFIKEMKRKGKVNMKGIDYYYINTDKSSIEIKSCESYLHSSQPHSHKEISIALIEEGQSNLVAGHNSYFIDSPSVLIIPSDIIHICNPVDLKKWKFKMIYLKDTSLPLELLELTREFQYRKLIPIELPEIKESFSRLRDKENLSKNIDELLERISEMFMTSLPIEFPQLREKIKLIKDSIDNSFTQELSLEKLSTLSNLSKYYIVREFRKHYGISPHKYINMKRVFFAKELMRKNKSIADSALESGFYDQSHLTRNFKRYTGITPMKYIKGTD